MTLAPARVKTRTTLVENLSPASAKAETTSNAYQRVVPFILFVLALLLLFELVRPMITVLLGSILLAYVAFPLYLRIGTKVRNKPASMILALFAIVIVILIPFSFLAFEITRQGYYFYDSLSGSIAEGALFGFGCTSAESKLCSILNSVEQFSVERLSALGFDSQLQKLLPILETKITLFFLSIPLLFAQAFLTVVIAYFIMVDWKRIVQKLADLLPMRPAAIEELIEKFNDISHTVIYAQLFVAGVQGIIGAIGFAIFGVPLPIFLGVLMAFCALIPTIGTALIWLPASLFLIGSGYFSGDAWVLWKGVGLFLYGLVIISTIDNVLLAKLVHTKAQVSQILVIVGVIGGAVMFGFIGIFVGPILLPLLITYFESFKARFD